MLNFTKISVQIEDVWRNSVWIRKLVGNKFEISRRPFKLRKIFGESWHVILTVM